MTPQYKKNEIYTMYVLYLNAMLISKETKKLASF